MQGKKRTSKKDEFEVNSRIKQGKTSVVTKPTKTEHKSTTFGSTGSKTSKDNVSLSQNDFSSISSSPANIKLEAQLEQSILPSIVTPVSTSSSDIVKRKYSKMPDEGKIDVKETIKGEKKPKHFGQTKADNDNMNDSEPAVANGQIVKLERRGRKKKNMIVQNRAKAAPSQAELPPEPDGERRSSGLSIASLLSSDTTTAPINSNNQNAPSSQHSRNLNNISSTLAEKHPGLLAD